MAFSQIEKANQYQGLFNLLSSEFGVIATVDDMNEIINEVQNGNFAKPLLSTVPFTYEWWIAVGQKAYWKAENFAWHTYYLEVADYCKSRAEDCEFKRHSR